MANSPTDIITPELEARFWAKVDRRGADECWPWLASKSPGGYGRIKIAERRGSATHVALNLDGHPRPDGAIALHSCDNPACCNPAHLRWGSDKENANDRAARGRAKYLRGSSNGRAKLTEDDVREIRASSLTQKELAAKFGVALSNIQSVIYRVAWAHVI